MKQIFMLLSFCALTATAQTDSHRALWASICSNGNVMTKSLDERAGALKKILVNWRQLPSDTVNNSSFDLYRTVKGGSEVKVNDAPIQGKTNFQDSDAPLTDAITYRLTFAGSNETLDTYTIDSIRVKNGRPYISIPLKGTSDLHPYYTYQANDVSVGDLDGDGEYEIVLKRLLYKDSTNITSTTTVPIIQHGCLLEAYKLDGSFLWRVCSGPNVTTGNGWSFAVADFDGDGKAEVAFRSAEGTIFGDGTEIGDTDGDGKTDYRTDKTSVGHYITAGPEFLSVVEGTTGRELARAPYIARETSEKWGDNYFKRASSYRVAVANVSGGNPSIITCRGVYARSALEAWDYNDGTLTKRWRFDTDSTGYNSWAGQGYHSLSVGDVDNDGFDEIVYGSMTVDHDGSGLNNSGLGHGDALHLGKFDPSREGLQIWSCFETGRTNAALRDAATGETIWASLAQEEGDCGRALVADIDPSSPGDECWWAGSNAHSITGEDLGYKPSTCNMAIWFSGSLNRQLLNGTVIDKTIVNGKQANARVATFYGSKRYDVADINDSKKNPCWYGDILGDWREEVILPVSGKTKELRIFATWYPTDYAFPWLMTDHVYEMSALNENIGYNQPTHTGYYLGSDLAKSPTTGITTARQAEGRVNDDRYYNLMGVEVKSPSHGVYIHNGKKVIIK